MRRLLGAVVLVVASLATVVPTAQAASPFSDCAPAGTTAVTIARVACTLVSGAAELGGDDPVSYFVPPACEHATCPALYLMHGFGGDYHSMLGTGDHPSPWVAALTSGPPVDPTKVLDPWNYSDPAHWVAKPPLDMVLIAPHGRTLPGGFGPAADEDSYWVDWNPRYARGGNDQVYATPPPRFDAFLHGELIPWAETVLHTGAGREHRALTGTSLGGFGSLRDALVHPDAWTSVGSVSGAFNFLFTPGFDPTGVSPPVGLPLGVALPHLTLPSISALAPLSAAPSAAQTLLAALLALGDPVSDQAYFRGNTPRDLAANGRAYAGNQQLLYLHAFANDTIPRRVADFQLPGYATAQGFEDIVLPMNLEQALAFRDVGVHWDFAIHPGLHGEPYRGVWYREQLVQQYRRLAHADGGGAHPTPPTTFDYRSIASDFSIWGWHVHVQRDNLEFLNLRAVTCRSITLQGTGVVAVDVPAACGTGVHGSPHVRVDLGPSLPIDDVGHLSATPVDGTTKTIALTPL